MINSNIEFKPNYYHFNIEQVNKEAAGFADKDTPDLSDLFKSKFYTAGVLDGVSACKYTETFLGLRMVNSGFQLDKVEAYLEFLLDLNRFDEVFDLCSKLISAKPIVSSPLLQRYLIQSALCMEEPEKIEHLMPETMDKDASVDDWIYFIQYHKLKGTHLSLLKKPLPSHESAVTYLYYICGEHSKILSKQLPKLKIATITPEKILDLWIIWLTLKKVDQKERANATLFGLLLKACKINRAVEELVLEQLSHEEHLYIQIDSYIEEVRITRPFSIKLLLLASKFSIEKSNSYRERARKLAATFSSLTNKRILIRSGAGNEESKMALLAKTASCVRPCLSLLAEVLQFYKKQKKESLEICKQIESKPISGALKEQIASTYAYFADSKEELEEALVKVEEALKAVAYSKTLYLYNITLLTKLNRFDEAENAIEKGISLFGFDEAFVILIKNLFERKNEIERAIAWLKRFDKEKQSFACISLLLELYNRYKTREEKFIFLCEHIFPTSFDYNYSSCLDEIKDFILNMQDQNRGVELLLKVKRDNNLNFLKLRISFLTQLGDYENALADADHLCEKQVQEGFPLKLTLLIQLARYKDAVQLALSFKSEFSENLLNRLISALENEDGWANEIVLIGERFKPKSYEARKSFAFAYVTLQEFDKALSLFNKLKSEDAKDLDVLNGRALCFQGKKLYSTALDQLNEILAIDPHNILSKTLIAEINQAKDDSSGKKSESHSEVKPASRKEKRNHGSVPVLIESPKEVSEAKLAHQQKFKAKAVQVHLQKTPANAVDPLTYSTQSLKAIKELARKGEKETEKAENKEVVSRESKAKARLDPPKLLVKTSLRDFDRVFLNRGLDALKGALAMNSSQLDQKVVFNNYIYAILRGFTPIRLNARLESLIEDLKAVRDTARHESDLIPFDKLAHLFAYLREIDLEGQLTDWICGKSAITKLCLKPYRFEKGARRKAPIERIMIELDLIRQRTGDKETWNERVYDRNAIKASLSIIGAASKYVSDELKSELSRFREEGNIVAHDFFEEGDTYEYTEKFKDEEIDPDALWTLAKQGIELFKKLTKASA